MFAVKLNFFLVILHVSVLPILRIDAGSEPSTDEDIEVNGFGVTWNYSNAAQWSRTFPTCAGDRQSPIDITSVHVVHYPQPIPNLQYNGYHNVPVSTTIRNTGDEVQIRPTYEDANIPYLSGALLDDDYLFEQIHFHWGPDDSGGSEHTVNGQSFPLEMHMVHRKRQYPNEDAAFKHADGFITIAVLFKLAAKGSPVCEKFAEYLSKVRQPFTNATIDAFPLTDFGFNEQDNFWTYPGSLTAPPCQEVVTLIIPQTLLTVVAEQMENFRQVKFSSGDNHNNRPTQPVGNRLIASIIYDNYQGDKGGP